MNIRTFLRQSVQVQRRDSVNPYGEYEYSDPETHPARKEIIQRQLRDQQGTQTLSSTRVTMIEELQVGDLIDGEAIADRENIVLLSGKVAGWRYFL